jgi:hypothetical protein
MLKPSLWRVICALTAGLILVLIAAWLSNSTGQVCGYGQGTKQNDCQTYNFAFFLILQTGEIVNYYGALITALATVAIAGFTYTLKQSTDNLWSAGERQLKLAEDEFKATHRAKVRVRRINLQGNRNDFNGFIFYLANTGDSDANIRTIGCGMARKETGAWLGDQPPNPQASVIIPQQPGLPMGPARPFLFVVAVDNDARAAVRDGLQELFVIGEIEYSDNSGIIRNTGFCWVYDRRIRDFRKSKEDKEYNYED